MVDVSANIGCIFRYRTVLEVWLSSSFSRSLWRCTMNLALYRSVAGVEVLITKMITPPSMLELTGMKISITNANYFRLRSPFISSGIVSWAC